MTTPLLLFALGLALAAAGGELFVRGVLAAARRLRLPAAVAGVTVAAFATSGPELGVSVLAALEGTPQLGLGDALGSNVVNLGLVLGLAILLAGLRAGAGAGDRRLLFLVAAPLLVGLLLLDGRLTRPDALALLGAFFAWLAWELRAIGRRVPAPARAPGDGLLLLLGLAGLLLLFAAGQLIVLAAREVARLSSMDPYVIGATLVALGTSVPELATVIAARARGHHEVGLGTLLGSNLFNGLFVVGTAALIHPIEIDPREAGVALAAALVLALMLVPGRGGMLPRRRGALLLAGYACYIAALAKVSVSPYP